METLRNEKYSPAAWVGCVERLCHFGNPSNSYYEVSPAFCMGPSQSTGHSLLKIIVNVSTLTLGGGWGGGEGGFFSA